MGEGSSWGGQGDVNEEFKFLGNFTKKIRGRGGGGSGGDGGQVGGSGWWGGQG